MKFSQILHGIAAISGVVGFLALIVAWVAGTNGTFIGFSQQHLYNDTTGLLLISIAAGLGTLIHLKLESKE